MVFVGTAVRAVHDTGGRLEPAAVDPSLAIAGERDPSEPEELAYHALTPGQRITYLDLISDLSNGVPSDAPPWCARLHLWGLERRVLVDFPARKHDPAAPDMLDRLERLMPMLDECDLPTVDALAVLVSSRLPPDGVVRPASLSVHMFETVPLAPDVIVGWYAAAGRSIPLDVRLELLDVCVPAPVPRARMICPEEFTALYGILQRDEQPIGQPLATTVRDVVVAPSSPSFKLPISVPTTVAESGDLAALFAGIGELADRAADDLEPYCRWRVVHPDDAPDLARRLLLPPELGGRDTAAAAELVHVARSVVDQPGELMSISKLTAGWSLGLVTSVDDYVDVLRVLERAGFGVVPDPRFEDPVDLGGTCLVFASERPAVPDPEMLWDLDMLRAAWRVIESDGRPNAAELWRLEDRIAATSGRDPTHDARVLATFRWLRDVDTGWLAMPELARGHQENELLAKFLVTLACTDGHYAPEEHTALVETFDAMGLDAVALDRLLDELTGHRVSHAPFTPSARAYDGADENVHDEMPYDDGGLTDDALDDSVPHDGVPSGGAPAELPPPELPEQVSTDSGRSVHVSVSEKQDTPTLATTNSPDGQILAALRQLAMEPELTVARARTIAQAHGFFWGALTELANELALDLTGRIVCDEHDDHVEVMLDVLEQMG